MAGYGTPQVLSLGALNSVLSCRSCPGASRWPTAGKRIKQVHTTAHQTRETEPLHSFHDSQTTLSARRLFVAANIHALLFPGCIKKKKTRNRSNFENCLHEMLDAPMDASETDIFSAFEKTESNLKSAGTGRNTMRAEEEMWLLREACEILLDVKKREKDELHRKTKMCTCRGKEKLWGTQRHSSRSDSSDETEERLSSWGREWDAKSEMDLDTWAQLVD